MILVLDNYDSFVYNLVQYVGFYGEEVEIYRNDQITVKEIAQKKPARIILSPGPGRPEEAGCMLDLIRELGSQIPMLGVCLGHQAMGLVFGGEVIRAPEIIHGKTSLISHDDRGIFKGVKNPVAATRYHSLIVDKDTFPDDLEITAQTEKGLIMGLRHRKYPLEGVQFHPESIITEEGMKMIGNFLEKQPLEMEIGS